jgi:hypothetical protein
VKRGDELFWLALLLVGLVIVWLAARRLFRSR